MWNPANPHRVAIRFYDRNTEQVRCEIPLERGVDAKPSPSGNYYAVTTESGLLQVWNVSPLPRWPWALAASLGTLLLVLFFGRWRYKRTKIA